jgi:DNA-binding response OmpR family regulator
MMDQKLLLVTEMPSAGEPLVDSLDHRGYEVDVATDRREALELSERNAYDVAVLDETIHESEGIEVFQEIERRQERVGGILCCDEPRIDDVYPAMQAGMDHVVAKPVDAEEIVSLIESATRESSRPFDQRFPDVPPGVETEEGVTKRRKAFWCETCGRTTHWSHKMLQLYFCCEDCLTRYLHHHSS